MKIIKFILIQATVFISLSTAAFAQTTPEQRPELTYGHACLAQAKEKMAALGTTSLPADIKSQLIKQCSCYAVNLKKLGQAAAMAKSEDTDTYTQLTQTYVETESMATTCGKALTFTATSTTTPTVTPEETFSQVCYQQTNAEFTKRGLPTPAGGPDKITSQCRCYATELKTRGESTRMSQTADTTNGIVVYQALKETYIDSNLLQPACGESLIPSGVTAATPPPVSATKSHSKAAPAALPKKVDSNEDTVNVDTKITDQKGASLKITQQYTSSGAFSTTCYNWIDKGISSCSVMPVTGGQSTDVHQSNCTVTGYEAKSGYVMNIAIGGTNLQLTLPSKPASTDKVLRDISGKTTLELYNTPNCGS